MPSDDERTCGAECPRHPGKTCDVSGIGDPRALLRGDFDRAIRSAKTTRHRHSHREKGSMPIPLGQGLPSPVRDVMLTHSWGGGKHLYGANSPHHVIPPLTETEYDAAAKLYRIRVQAPRIWAVVEGFLKFGYFVETDPSKQAAAVQAFLEKVVDIENEIDPESVVSEVNP